MVLNNEIETLLKQKTDFTFDNKTIPIIPFNDTKLYNDFRLWLNDQDDPNTVVEKLQDYFKLCDASFKATYSDKHLKNIIFDITGDSTTSYEITNSTISVLGLKDPSQVKNILESVYIIQSEVTDNKLSINIVLPKWDEVI